MNEHRLLSAFGSRLTRVLALAALLLVAGVQVLEAGHSHGVDGALAGCLLCKSASDPAPLAAVPTLALFCLAALTTMFWPGIAPLLTVFSFLARGPPPHS